MIFIAMVMAAISLGIGIIAGILLWRAWHAPVPMTPDEQAAVDYVEHQHSPLDREVK